MLCKKKPKLENLKKSRSIPTAQIEKARPEKNTKGGAQ